MTPTENAMFVWLNYNRLKQYTEHVNCVIGVGLQSLHHVSDCIISIGSCWWDVQMILRQNIKHIILIDDTTRPWSLGGAGQHMCGAAFDSLTL